MPLNRTEYLLVKLAEECAEVAQRATKALTFGLKEVQHDQPYDNSERLVHELADLAGVVRMLEEAGAIELAEEFDKRRRAKPAWVEKYMAYSREVGCLS